MAYFAYQSYPTVYTDPLIKMNNDVTTSMRKNGQEVVVPAGMLYAFSSRSERDQWVGDGPTVHRNSYGFVERYSHRSPVLAKEARRLMRLGGLELAEMGIGGGC